jgi:hypothetical protein
MTTRKEKKAYIIISIPEKHLLFYKITYNLVVVPIDIEYVLLKALELKKTEENHIKSAMGFLIRKNLDIFSYSDADEWFKDNFEN